MFSGTLFGWVTSAGHHLERKVRNASVNIINIALSFSGMKHGESGTEETTHKPVAAHFYPQNVLVVGFLSRSTVVTEPAALGHVNVQTLTVKGSRARFTAEQTSSYRERQKTNVILINNCSKMFALSSRLTITVFSNLENNSLSKHH